jgi:hypothetical protein
MYLLGVGAISAQQAPAAGCTAALRTPAIHAHQHLAAKGYMARGGQMVDATIVPVPTQRNSRDENEAVKAGRIPEESEAKLHQKDRDARWTKRVWQEFFRIQET